MLSSAYSQNILTDSISEVTVVGKHNDDVNSSTPLHSLTSNDIVKQGVTDIADALHRLPGITLRDYGGAGGMKTVSVRGFGSQHTGVSYDGLMLSDCQTGQIDLQRYSLDNIESISLNIGDADEIFVPARNISSSATLNLHTGSEDLCKIKVKTGSWGLINPSLWLKNKGERFNISGCAEYLHADNNYPFELTNYKTVTEERRRNSKMDQGNCEMNFTVNSHRSTVNCKLYYYDNSRELPGIVHYYTDDNDEHLRERNIFAQMQYKNLLSEKWSVMFNGRWNWAESDYYNGKPSGGVTSADYFQREYYGSGAVMFAPMKDLALDYSVDYWNNNLNGQQSTVNSQKPDRKSLLQSLAVKYSPNNWTVLARLLKSDYMGEAHRLSPSMSISHCRNIESVFWTIRASYKDIFRMPTFNELYFFHLGDQELLPEKTSQFNLGLALKTEGKMIKSQGSIDIYYNKVNDKIVSIPINMFVWRNINMAKVDAIGLDATADVSFNLNRSHCIGVNGNYSLQRIQNTTNSESQYYKNQVAYTPVHSGSVTLSWQNPWLNLSMTGDGMSKRWTTNEHTDGTELSGFMEFSVNAYREFQVSGFRFKVQGTVLNMFNKQYDIVAHYPMPGRSFRISLEMRL